MGNVINSIGGGVHDTKWIAFPYNNSNFTDYSSGQSLRYRKLDKLVEVRGVIKNVGTFNSGTTAIVIGYLPDGFRPSKLVSRVNQASGCAKIVTLVYSDGRLAFQRYSTNGTISTNITAGRWINMNIMFLID